MLLEEEILEWNILLHKFIGFRETTIEEKCKFIGTGCDIERLNRMIEQTPKYIPTLINDKGDYYFEDSLNYNKKWSELMKVVEKIMGTSSVIINNHGCFIEHCDEKFKVNTFKSYDENLSLILNVFIVVVKYVKFSNENLVN